jgi:hypothetical protein
VPCRVFLTSTPDHWQPWEGTPYIEAVTADFRLRSQNEFTLTDRPQDADIILFLEPNYFKGREYARMLLRHELIREFPNQCFVFSYDDFPIGYLPGVYVAMPRQAMDYKRFRSCSYLQEPNPFCIEKTEENIQPHFLFSFRGARSAAVRESIFNLANGLQGSASITEMKKWYNHSDEEKKAYVHEILESKFVLCPRGQGVSSHRLFETMKLGRIPVILSDPWVPPDGPDWLNCSVRIAEQNVRFIPQILADLENRAEAIGRLAREEWIKWFSPQSRVFTVLKYIEDIKRQRDTDERDLQKLWLKNSFYIPYGLHPWQRIKERFKSGQLIEPIRRRLKQAIARKKH